MGPFLRHSFALALLLQLLVGLGCARTPPIPPVADPHTAWQARQTALEGITHWTAIGRVGIRSSEDAWSASIRWEQSDERYRIRLSGPFGQGVMQVVGRPGHVELRTADEGVHAAARPDELLAARTGFEVPVSLLRYWLLGRAGPSAPVEGLVLDPVGRPVALRQAGWALEIERYAGPGPLALPTKLNVTGAEIAARVVVRDWQIGS